MKAAAVRDKRLIVAELPVPEPGPGEVLVKTLACGICGSDLHALKPAEQFAASYRRAEAPALPPERWRGSTMVFACVGVPGVIDQIMTAAPRGARIVIVGVCMEPDTIHPPRGIGKGAEPAVRARRRPRGVRGDPAPHRGGDDPDGAAGHGHGRRRRRGRRVHGGRVAGAAREDPRRALARRCGRHARRRPASATAATTAAGTHTRRSSALNTRQPHSLKKCAASGETGMGRHGMK